MIEVRWLSTAGEIAPPERLQQVIEASGARTRGERQQLLLARRASAGVVSSSRERSALANASLKVRPSDIASPTDFMWVVSSSSAPGNFSNAKRGHLTTQ